MVDPADNSDSLLADWLNKLVDSARRGESPDVDATAASHPELKAELRRLWTMAQVADAAAGQWVVNALREPTQAEAAQVSACPPLPDSWGSKEAEPDEAATIAGQAEPASVYDANTTPASVLGDYDLLEEIGRGGMGIVYRARQRSLDRTVAVKVILQGTLASEEDQARFQSEATAAAQLDHPDIVPIYEVSSDSGQWFFSMQWVEGQTLADRLAAGPMPAREAAQIMLGVARAIDYAHQRGIVHRDLKPANILLDRSGKPHVSDFGLAKRVAAGASLTRSGAVLGTPSYMAPEQASGDQDVGPASDIYSLGTVLYALLTGRPPFQGPSPVDTLLMLLEQDPLPPRLLNRRVDPDLERIALKCLQRPQELRYRSAGALADDLEAYLEGGPIAARSGRFSQIWSRLLRETHHATILENWGLLWMWHAAVLLAICLLTEWLHAQRGRWPQMNSPLPYMLLWGGALAIWAPTFWALRKRAGPVTAVERQIAHVWGGSIAAVMLLFVVESLLRLPVLTLSPVLGITSGMVFCVKAGILAGAFYVHAAALFLTALIMAWMQRNDIPGSVALFGCVAAATFFLPGWKYFRQSRRKTGGRKADEAARDS